MSDIKIEVIVEKSAKLKQAVKDSNIPQIVELVNAGASTDIEIGGVPILLYAAQRGLWDVVEELFMLNANMDIKYDILNWALIHQLSQGGNDVQLTSYLPFIEDKNLAEESKNQNALMIAIEAGKKSTFEILLDHGVDLRSKDKKGNNVLHYVARAGWIDILNQLAEKNIHLYSAPNKDGETVLSITNMKLSDFIDVSKSVSVNDNEVNVLETEVITDTTNTTVEEIKAPAKNKLSKIKKIS